MARRCVSGSQGVGYGSDLWGTITSKAKRRSQGSWLRRFVLERWVVRLVEGVDVAGQEDTQLTFRNSIESSRSQTQPTRLCFDSGIPNCNDYILWQFIWTRRVEWPDVLSGRSEQRGNRLLPSPQGGSTKVCAR